MMQSLGVLRSPTQKLVPYLFLFPAVTLIIVFNIIPAFATINESLYRNPLNPRLPREFVGLDNFERVLDDPTFWNALEVTLAFSLVVNPVQIALALLVALLMNQRVPGIHLFRTIYLIPVAISINVTVIIWRLMLNQNSGLINSLLAGMGLERQPFLLSPDQALASIILILSWKGMFFWALFFLAALQGIPDTVVEAARIDGAGRWKVLTRITIPLLRHVILFTLVADTVINFIQFTPVYLLTRGGPEQSTNLIMYEIYRRGFVYGDLGGSSAMLTIMLGVVMLVIAGQMLLLRNRQ